jgi:GDP-D-mannose 3',5'-epimerase
MFAADMGGMGFIERNKLACMMTVRATAAMLEAAVDAGVSRYFYASSACAYSSVHQADTYGPALAEWMAYPADPEDGYGWEKLFGERLARHAYEDTGMETRVARYHNIYGAPCEWEEPRSKAPAALCRKVAEAVADGAESIELWGDGQATRSFCYLDDCIEGTRRLMASDYREPLNIGSDELVTVDGLARKIEAIAGVTLAHRHDPSAPQGVRGRNSDNTRCREVLGWAPSTSLDVGLADLYGWVSRQVHERIAVA